MNFDVWIVLQLFIAVSAGTISRAIWQGVGDFHVWTLIKQVGFPICLCMGVILTFRNKIFFINTEDRWSLIGTGLLAGASFPQIISFVDKMFNKNKE